MTNFNKGVMDKLAGLWDPDLSKPTLFDADPAVTPVAAFKALPYGAQAGVAAGAVALPTLAAYAIYKARQRKHKPEKTAQYRGYKPIALQSYMPLQKRRKFSRTEEQQIDEHENSLLPKIWQSKQTPLYELLASPGKTSAGVLGAGAVLGGAVGSLGGLKGGIAGTGIGAAAAGIPAILAFYKRRQMNEDILEQLRRLPEGATMRDMEADPTYQADLDREAQAAALMDMARDYGIGKQASPIGTAIRSVLRNPETKRLGISAAASVPYTIADYRYITPAITQMSGGDLQPLTPKNNLEAVLAYAANAASIRGFMGGKNPNKVDWSKIPEGQKARILESRGPVKRLTNWAMTTPYGRAASTSVPLLASTALIRGTANEQGVPLMGVVNTGRKITKGVSDIAGMAGNLSVPEDPNKPGLMTTFRNTLEKAQKALEPKLGPDGKPLPSIGEWLSNIPVRADAALNNFGKTWDTMAPYYGGATGAAIGGTIANTLKSDPMLHDDVKSRKRAELRNKLLLLAGAVGGAGVGYGVSGGKLPDIKGLFKPQGAK